MSDSSFDPVSSLFVKLWSPDKLWPEDNSGSLCLTWLEGDLAEQHPGIGEVELALDGAGHVVGQVDGDEAGARVLLVRHGAEGQRRGLPVRLRAEVAHDLPEDLHVPGEHVVAVDLDAH